MAARRRAGRGARVTCSHGRGGARVHAERIQWTVPTEHGAARLPRAARRVAATLRRSCPIASIVYSAVEYSILTLTHRHSE